MALARNHNKTICFAVSGSLCVLFVCTQSSCHCCVVKKKRGEQQQNAKGKCDWFDCFCEFCVWIVVRRISSEITHSLFSIYTERKQQSFCKSKTKISKTVQTFHFFIRFHHRRFSIQNTLVRPVRECFRYRAFPRVHCSSHSLYRPPPSPNNRASWPVAASVRMSRTTIGLRITLTLPRPTKTTEFIGQESASWSAQCVSICANPSTAETAFGTETSCRPSRAIDPRLCGK